MNLSPEAEQLLNYLHRGGGWGYYWRGGDKTSTWFTAGHPGKLPAVENVYFGVHPSIIQRGPSQRARTGDIAAISCLFAEFDAKDFDGDKGETLTHIYGLPYPPQICIDSGGGFHCYWLLSEPVLLADENTRERVRLLQAAWVEYNGGDQGAKDLARVLRVPGTLNTKYSPARPVSVLWADWDISYDLAKLEAAITAAGKNTQPKRAEPETKLQYRNSGEASDYWMGRALQQAAPGSRNRIGFWLACQLRDSGVPKGQAESLPYPERVPHSRDPYTRRDWERTIESAYSRAARDPAQGNGRYTAPVTEVLEMLPPATTTAPLSLASITQAEIQNEAGDADLFAQLHAGLIAFDHAARSWHIWANNFWQLDKTNEVYNWVTKRLAATYLRGAADALEAGKNDLAARFSKRANLLQAKKRADNVIFLAAAQEELALSGDEWDADPWLLGVENGVIDLRTGEHRPGRPSDYIRAHAPSYFQAIDTPAPRWERFISEIFNGDQELMGFLQRLLGYGITGLTREHILPVFIGPDGRNGKSTLLETLGAVLGPDLATSSQADSLMDLGGRGDGPRPFVFALRGKRLVWASESNEGRRLNAGLVKQLTGGDKLNVRTLHSKPVEFSPTHMLLLITNHRPHIPADDQAIWDRVFLLPFTMRFIDNPTKPNERKADKALKETLRTEAPGILAWLVRGCLSWQREGLLPPRVVKAATEEYRAEEDTLSQFIAECCVISEGAKTGGLKLYEAYTAWARESGEKPMSKNAFGQRLKRRFELVPPTNVVTYGGIGLKANEP